MGHASTTEYAKRAKQGFLLGAGLFVFGAGGQIVGRSVYGELSGLIQTLLFDAEVLGILIALLVPLVFAIALPLVE